MRVTVCIGSSCHLKGARQVIERLKQLIAERELESRVELAGQFCMGDCQHGVSVTLDGEQRSLTPEGVNAFFENEVLTKVAARTRG
ncbi:MAG: (2Fe-2S) ferredoxin domain-containing protein [Christensenellaceae bacterium]|nr:(2Fe-2S) ferredoxin domain-containing protein [Christensenellaceae bacterium]MEA5066364.1 (2Fe-2S) ferredoxin domain-containing protein [Eubacteriales bacterium]MEA5070091.1 (2Fe-2S) ferredoxin domain-containing protein [Christensenellaceae bacterium]